MPNWCYNRITIYGDSETEAKLKEIEKIFESKQPFNEIYPIPDFKNIPNEKGELPKLEQHKNDKGDVVWETFNFPDGTNDDRWYSWCINNWGTKWDACDKSIDWEDDEILALTFNTAWSPPEGIVERLRDKYPELTFQCFYDEPGMESAGYYQDSLESVTYGVALRNPNAIIKTQRRTSMIRSYCYKSSNSFTPKHYEKD